ncbi:MAG: amino acid kinase [Gemmatimonadota bacterium]|nr:amino acid kinase [Gemmatimonadota bacterium]
MPEGLTVVKVGGGLLAQPGLLPRVGQALARLADERAVVIIPGGGPFADQVRQFDQRHGLSPTSAHWMAILAMDQFAWVIAAEVSGSRIVEDRAGILQAHREGAIPVLAPSRWLRATDELPHRWEVTSDSLAAYLATLLGAPELILVKPVSGGTELVDAWFLRVAPADLRVRIVGAAEFAAGG